MCGEIIIFQNINKDKIACPQSVCNQQIYTIIILKKTQVSFGLRDRKGLSNSVSDVESSSEWEPTLSPLGPTPPCEFYG